MHAARPEEEHAVETVVTVFALIFVLFLALGAYATVKAVGAAKRGVDRTVAQARRSVEDTTLRAKAVGRPGPAGELAQLRLDLRTSMRATQDALYAAVEEDESLKESVSLFERLSAHGRELDAELRRLESDPDRARLAARLPGLRERAERITESADSLRWAARDRAHRFAGDDLDSLSAQIDVEAGALRHWTPATPPVTPPPVQWPEPAGDARDAEGAGQPREAADGATSARDAGEPVRDPEASARPAIGRADLRRTYPWQKNAPRPERTT